MGILDSARSALSKNRDKVMQGIDVATEQARKITPVQHSAKLSKAANAAKSAVDKLDSPTGSTVEGSNEDDASSKHTGSNEDDASSNDADSTSNEDGASSNDADSTSNEGPGGGSTGDAGNV